MNLWTAQITVSDGSFIDSPHKGNFMTGPIDTSKVRIWGAEYKITVIEGVKLEEPIIGFSGTAYEEKEYKDWMRDSWWRDVKQWIQKEIELYKSRATAR